MAVCQMQQAWVLIGIWLRENKHEVEWASSINLAPDRFASYSRYTILQMAATPSTIFSFLLVAAVIQDVPGLVSQIGFHIFFFFCLSHLLAVSCFNTLYLCCLVFFPVTALWRKPDGLMPLFIQRWARHETFLQKKKLYENSISTCFALRWCSQAIQPVCTWRSHVMEPSNNDKIWWQNGKILEGLILYKSIVCIWEKT